MTSVRATSRAFTLTELLVSIAAVALLTAGVGRIFSSISSLVSTGSAVSQVDQIARALEAQLRDDFDAFNRMRPEETFLAIRMREIGDIDRNGILNIGAGEAPIYLTIEDRDADRRDIVEGLIDGPYAQGSRAVTRRLDEIMFIGFNGFDRYSSYQIDPTPDAAPAWSQYARIYYGHGLRPVPDPDFPPLDPATGPRVPTRWFYPDGDFGASANPSVADPLLSENRFDPNNNTTLLTTTGRNEFAAQWPLLRQPLLLYGPDAAGYTTGSGFEVRSPIGVEREIAPFARDIELEQRAQDWLDVDNEIDLDTQGFVNTSDFPSTARPDYRRLRDGRVDICPMTRLDLRRWLEGQSVTSTDPSDSGQPFLGGRLATLNTSPPGELDNTSANEPIWIRAGMGDDPEINNRVGVQRAIAGMFNRYQTESVPPRILRAPDPGRDEPERPEDALMDLHAVLATRCSNFEIAWSDGSVALDDISFSGVGEPDVKWGELIWFDISPLGTESNPRRSLFQNWSSLGAGLIDLRSSGAALDRLNEAEITRFDPAFLDPNDDAFFDNEGYYDDASADNAQIMIGANAGGVPDAGGAQYPAYSTLLNGGAPSPEGEALVIFPFRTPTDNGGWSGAWNKQIFIRIRVTLHDALGRLPEGKDYEFIFALNPKGF